MFTKSIKLSFFALLLLSIFVTSCQKEDILTETENFEGDINFSEYGDIAHYRILDNDCFKLTFPIHIETADGNLTEVADRAGLRDIIKDWKASDLGTADRPRLVFPYDVLTKDGDEITIESDEDIKDLRYNCKGPYHRNKCFKMVFPATVVFPNGEQVQINNRRALYHLVKAWKANNPNNDGRPKFTFPYTIELREGTIITVENQEDVAEVRKECFGLFKKYKCFKTVFPVTVVFPNGSTAGPLEPHAFREVIKLWKQNNPDATERPTIAFPHDIELEDGTIITVDNKEELKEYISTCREYYHKRRCFKVIFPVVIDFPDGTTADALDRKAAKELVLQWIVDHPDAEDKPSLAFPYTVEIKDGSVLMIENEEDKAKLKELCD